MQKDKVLIVITKSNWGGAQKYVFDLATNMPKDKYEVEVIFGGNGILAQKLDTAGIKTESISELGRDINPIKDFKIFFKLINVFKEKKPDIVHLNSSKIGAMGVLACRLTGIKRIIFTAHGWAFNENRSLISRIILKIIYWITIFLSHKTIVVSKGMSKHVGDWWFVKRKIVNIHNGISIINFIDKIKAKKEITNRLPLLKSNIQNKWVGTIAELHPIKNLDLAIQAFSILQKDYPDIKYIIIGEGEDKNKLEQLILKNNLSDTVFLTGSIQEAGKYLKAFDIFLLPSKSEALGYVLLESGLAEIPTIATNVGGIPEIIEDQKTGLLIRANDNEEIVSAIRYYINNPDIAQKNAHTLRNKIKTQFSIEKMILSTIEIYKK